MEWDADADQLLNKLKKLDLRWPAMMKRQTLARYCEISVADVERRIYAGQLPPPVQFGKQPRWHRETVDRYLAELTEDYEPEWRRRLREGAKSARLKAPDAG